MDRVITGITTALGHPVAIPVLLVFVSIMFVATGIDAANISISILTLMLLPVLQHAQTKDTTAVQAKLDELIRSSDARNDFIGVDKKTVKDIEELRDDGVS